MKSDLFVLIPCHIQDGGKIEQFNQDIESDYGKDYLATLEEVSQTELVNRVNKSFNRAFLGTHKLSVYSDSSGPKKLIEVIDVYMFITYCHINRLAVLSLVVNDYMGNVSTIIDQVAREDMIINDMSIDTFLKQEFQLVKNGEAKMVLTQNHKNEDEILYYLATETSESELVKTNIISPKYIDFSKKNIAVYDFSDIYASEALVYQVFKEKNNQLQYQGLLVFIVEILVMQLSAVYRTNNKVSMALEENLQLNVKDYEKYSIEFANTMSLWQIDIYRYKGAQSIANIISERFGIQRVLDNYKQNDKFLQNIINTNNVKNSLFESWILFVIAVVLFLKEVFVIVKNIIIAIVDGSSISSMDIISSISSTSIIIILLIAAYFIRKKRILN